MQTDDADKLFQADVDAARFEARQQKAKATVHLGDPIKLSSKPLDFVLHGDDVWLAESGFTARCIDLKTGKTKHVFRGGHSGPVTCLALWQTKSRLLLFTGSWDKTIVLWDVKTYAILARIQNAHTDFVKCLLIVPSLSVLISGGSDKDLRYWDLRTLETADWTPLIDYKFDTETDEGDLVRPTGLLPPVRAPLRLMGNDVKGYPAPLHMPQAGSQAHTRPIECLACSAISSSSKEYALWSADSMGKVCSWRLMRNEDRVVATFAWQARLHETAIYALSLAEDELWTASADKDVLMSSVTLDDPSKPPMPRLRIRHPDYVKSVLPLANCLPGAHHVVTGSSDEAIRIFDLAMLDSLTEAERLTGLKANAPKGLINEVQAHFHDVVHLAIWTETTAAGKRHPWLLTASFDATLRKWPWPDVLTFAPAPAEAAPKPETDTLTAEEEAELNELMS
ncbi:hypothetical protein E5Q_01842 [Mixia osmundae IAM 14324]|uniref:Uncharacterized protein n=1 Tax=Mixia osmundae (strain CBS 9802 / IAM 14324 / JCM 22182 / KY 12970) TaxID=764103 RepID=G7DX77_MIXOS|nr:hypothetical protein E5Q_01842 [Mixia osmundae IAM 14324]